MTTAHPAPEAPARTAGIHHVTAIAGDAQRTLDFYAGVLGLRLVKRTVNFDDPTTYHFYFGDAEGTPGSILTFFPWSGAPRGRLGTGQAAVTALAIPPAALGVWLDRLAAHGVAHELPARRFGGETAVAFHDPDGMRLELVTDPAVAAIPGWEGGPVPAEHAIRGVFGVTLWVERGEATARVLVGQLGLREVAREGAREGAVTRYVADGATLGRVVDVREAGGFWRGATGVGTVHHVAFRAADDAAQGALRRQVMQAGHSATPVLDRNYFRSIYFREPGGVLFEIATDPPGFLVDETPDALGRALRLPPQYEPHRAEIEAALPPIALPEPPIAAAAALAGGA